MSVMVDTSVWIQFLSTEHHTQVSSMSFSAAMK